MLAALLLLGRSLADARRYGFTPSGASSTPAFGPASPSTRSSSSAGLLQGRRDRLLLPLAVLAWWRGVESALPPLLSYAFRPELFELLRDVDHWPRDSGRQFNANALRDPPESEARHGGGLNLIVLGDTFTSAMG